MTEKYTPEKVAELVAAARKFIRYHASEDDETIITRLTDALTAVSANRDEFRTAWNAYGFDIIRLEDDRDRLHKAITEALAVNETSWRRADVRAILRAALDKEGNDDE